MFSFVITSLLIHFILVQQRNVGILEKIVASLTAGGSAAVRNKSELQLQYKAQVDVIGQLGDKVRRLVQEQKSNSATSSSSTTTTTMKTALIKLERDFERVQSRALSLQHSVTRQEQQAAASAAASRQQQESQNNNNAVEEYQRQMQLQMQQDVSK